MSVRDAFTGTYAMTSETGTVNLRFVTYRGDAAIVQLRTLGYDPKHSVVIPPAYCQPTFLIDGFE